MKRAISEGVRLEALSIDALKEASDVFEDDVRDVLSHKASTDSRDVEGGTSRRSVLVQIDRGRKLIGERRRIRSDS